MGAPIRLFVLDRCRLFAECLCRTLVSHEQLVLFGAGSDPEEAYAAVAAGGVDILLLCADPTTPAVLRAVRRLRPEQNVVLLGLADCIENVLPMIEAGAAGYVTKDAHLADLLETIQIVNAAQARCSARITAAVFRRVWQLSQTAAPPPAGQPDKLSVREKQVLEMIALGLANKQIARKLGIALCTVKNHVHHVLDKLQVAHRRDAIRYACGNGHTADDSAG
jgi:DNA-binding NarL/FixJ family response regulator